jgi:hypothetical protein
MRRYRVLVRALAMRHCRSLDRCSMWRPIRMNPRSRMTAAWWSWLRWRACGCCSLAMSNRPASRRLWALGRTFVSVDLFGSVSSLGADAISARDADDRAAQLKTRDEALALLARAESNSDQVLARAIALRAFTNVQQPLSAGAWRPVLDAYCTSRPTIATKLAELAEARRSSVEKSFGRSVIFSLNKPRELERMSDSQIQAAAGGAFAS